MSCGGQPVRDDEGQNFRLRATEALTMRRILTQGPRTQPVVQTVLRQPLIFRTGGAGARDQC